MHLSAKADRLFLYFRGLHHYFSAIQHVAISIEIGAVIQVLLASFGAGSDLRRFCFVVRSARARALF